MRCRSSLCCCCLPVGAETRVERTSGLWSEHANARERSTRARHAMRLPTRDTNRAVLFARAIQERPHADGIGGSHAGSRMCAAASRNLASPWKPASPSIAHRQAVVGASNKWPSARPPPMRGANARYAAPGSLVITPSPSHSHSIHRGVVPSVGHVHWLAHL